LLNLLEDDTDRLDKHRYSVDREKEKKRGCAQWHLNGRIKAKSKEEGWVYSVEGMGTPGGFVG